MPAKAAAMQWPISTSKPAGTTPVSMTDWTPSAISLSCALALSL